MLTPEETQRQRLHLYFTTDHDRQGHPHPVGFPNFPAAEVPAAERALRALLDAHTPPRKSHAHTRRNPAPPTQA